MTRDNISPAAVDTAMGSLRIKLNKTLEKKGWGAFTSPHEVLGSLTEEMKELTDAVHENDIPNFREELLDIAISAIFAYASAYEVRS